MRFAVILGEARYGFPSHVFCAMNPSSIKMPKKRDSSPRRSVWGAKPALRRLRSE
jgi:hypothetical protein